MLKQTFLSCGFVVALAAGPAWAATATAGGTVAAPATSVGAGANGNVSAAPSSVINGNMSAAPNSVINGNVGAAPNSVTGTVDANAPSTLTTPGANLRQVRHDDVTEPRFAEWRKRHCVAGSTDARCNGTNNAVTPANASNDPNAAAGINQGVNTPQSNAGMYAPQNNSGVNSAP